SLINKLWSKNTKNRVIAESTAAEVLNNMGIGPDIDYSDKDYYTFDFIHYQRDDLDFYFVRNTTDQWISRNTSFRQEKKVPEIWDPVTGEINQVTIYHQEENYIEMPLSLPPFGAQFVVFKPGDQKPIYSGIDNGGMYPPRLSYTKDGVLILDEGKVAMIKGDQPFTVANEIKIQPIDGAWEVNFSEEWGAPEKVVLGELKSWTDFEEEGIKYYSGTARYKTIIHYEINSSVAENQSVLLDLGEVSKIGEVWLNGEPLGICWTKPFQFDVTEYIKPGDNVLEIEVANTWSNRMVGDRLTEGKGYTYSNIQVTSLKGLDKIRFPWAEVPLIESGLLGPVKLITLTPLE
ncbi:MAG: glycosyl hydrolase, partial [Cyclobacteriaceae bacterium]